MTKKKGSDDRPRICNRSEIRKFLGHLEKRSSLGLIYRLINGRTMHKRSRRRCSGMPDIANVLGGALTVMGKAERSHIAGTGNGGAISTSHERQRRPQEREGERRKRGEREASRASVGERVGGIRIKLARSQVAVKGGTTKRIHRGTPALPLSVRRIWGSSTRSGDTTRTT